MTAMVANNETGALLPTGDLAALCRSRGVPLHADAAQAASTLDLSSLGADLVTVSAHKIGGPKGAGALLCPRRLRFRPFITGGHQERGLVAGTENVAALVPGMLLDLQTRGQLAAGLTSYNPERDQLIDTFKDVGVVSEVFRMSRPEKYASVIEEYAGKAAIGHTRYATAGGDDVRYAQPFERHHGRLWKWFSFAFNGTVSNYTELRDKLLSKQGFH